MYSFGAHSIIIKHLCCVNFYNSFLSEPLQNISMQWINADRIFDVSQHCNMSHIMMSHLRMCDYPLQFSRIDDINLHNSWQVSQKQYCHHQLPYNDVDHRSIIAVSLSIYPLIVFQKLSYFGIILLSSRKSQKTFSPRLTQS